MSDTESLLSLTDPSFSISLGKLTDSSVVREADNGTKCFVKCTVIPILHGCLHDYEYFFPQIYTSKVFHFAYTLSLKKKTVT